MPDQPIPTAINNPFLSDDGLFRLQLDTKQRFENMALQTPMSFQAPQMPEVDMHERPSQSDVLDPQLNVGTIGDALFHSDPRISSLASGYLQDSSTKTVTARGVGVPEQFRYDDSMDRYLNGQFGYNPYKSVEENEQFYYNNEWMKKGVLNKVFSTVGTGLSRFVAGVGLKTVSTLGYTGAMVWNGLQEIFDGTDNNAMVDISNNALSRWAEDTEKDMKNSNLLAVFKPQGWNDKGFWSKLTNGAFWSDEVADGAAFMGEMMLTSWGMGALAGKIGWLSKLGQTTINLGKYGKGLKLLDYGVKALTGAKDINGIGRWAFMTTSESAMEAAGKYADIKRQLRQERDQGLNNLSDDEIDGKAGNAAASSFKDNMVILGLSNAFENRFIFEPLFSRERRARRALGLAEREGEDFGDYIRVGKGMKNTDELAKASRARYGIGKFSIDKTSRLGFYGPRALKATAVEGYWEENAQLATERLSASEDYQNAGVGTRKFELLSQTAKQAWNAFLGDDPEAATNIGLGGVIGILGTAGVSKIAQGSKPFQGERRRLRSILGGAETDPQTGVTNYTGLIGNYEQFRKNFLSLQNMYDIDENGDMILNEKKAAAILDGMVDMTNHQQRIDAVSNPLLKQYLQEQMMTKFAYAAMSAGIMDRVIKRFETMGNRLSTDDLKKMGYDPNTAQDVNDHIATLTHMAKLYSEAHGDDIVPPKGLKKADVKDWYNDELNRRSQTYFAKARAYSARKIAEKYFLDFQDEKQVANPLSASSAESISQVDQYNSLVYQQHVLNNFASSAINKKFYADHIEAENKRIEEEKKKLRTILDNKISSAVKGTKTTEEGEVDSEVVEAIKPTLFETSDGYFVSKERYDEIKAHSVNPMASFEGGVHTSTVLGHDAVRSQHAIDSRSQAKHAELTVQAGIDEWLAKHMEGGVENYRNYKKEVLEPTREKDEAAAEEEEKKEMSSETPPSPPAPTAATNPAEEKPTVAPKPKAETTPETPVAEAPKTELTPEQRAQERADAQVVNELWAAIRANNFAQIGVLKDKVLKMSKDFILKQFDIARKKKSLQDVLDKIAAIVRELVGDEMFDNHMGGEELSKLQNQESQLPKEEEQTPPAQNEGEGNKSAVVQPTESPLDTAQGTVRTEPVTTSTESTEKKIPEVPSDLSKYDFSGLVGKTVTERNDLIAETHVYEFKGLKTFFNGDTNELGMNALLDGKEHPLRLRDVWEIAHRNGLGDLIKLKPSEEEETKRKAEEERKQREEEDRKKIEEQEKENERKKQEAEAAAKEPIATNDVPPGTDNPESPQVWNGDVPVGENVLTTLTDESRQASEFAFYTQNPNELEMDGNKPKMDDKGVVQLRTLSEPMLLRQRNVLNWLSQQFSEDEGNFEQYRISLEILNEENAKWGYFDEKNKNKLVSVLVDKDGGYVYFDKTGRRTDEIGGDPFALQFEDEWYTREKLNISRDSIAGVGTPRQSGFQVEEPLNILFNLLHNKQKVYGSVLGVLNGPLVRNSSTNRYSNQAKKEGEYGMRSLEQLENEGVIKLDFLDVKIDGFYLQDNPNADQRTKIGKPYMYDYNSGLYIPVEGKRLRDVSFNGTKITPGSRLHQIIDVLDKKGSISPDEKQEGGGRMVKDADELFQVYQFLRDMLYSQEVQLILESDGSVRVRKAAGRDNQGAPGFSLLPLQARSLWDAPINFVRRLNNSRGSVTLPISQNLETGDTHVVDYKDFVKENFMTGAALAQVQKGAEPQFTKVNRRLVFKLDESYEELKKRINESAKNLHTVDEAPKVGDHYVPMRDQSVLYKVSAWDEEGQKVTVVPVGEETEGTEKEIEMRFFKEKWLKMAAPEVVEPVQKTDAQKATIEQVRKLRKGPGNTRPKSVYRVTGFARPSKSEGFTTSAAFVMGNVIDHMAKNIFMGRKVSVSDRINLGDDVKGTLGDSFISTVAFDKTVEHLTFLRDQLAKQGYHFETDLLVYDKETDIAGEIDLALISPEGTVMIGDFKTSKTGEFDEAHLNRTYDEVTEREYFATQGYLYASLLAKQTGLKVEEQTFILGIPISYKEGEVSVYSSQLVGTRNLPNHVIRFSPSQVSHYYLKDGKPVPFTEFPAIYNQVKNQNTGSDVLEEDPDEKRRKRKGGAPLEMSIKDINQRAAPNAQLQAELQDMEQMFGQRMVVRFSNLMNRYRYGQWTTTGTIIYQNAVAGTVYHEGFHQFSQVFLTRGEKIKTYASLRNQAISFVDRAGVLQNTANLTDLDIEEFMADEWVKYVQAQKAGSKYEFPGKSKGIIGFFKNLWQLLKNWFSGAKDPMHLFKDLYAGNLAKYNPDVNNALFGVLNSAVVDKNGQEVLSHARSAAYISLTDQLLKTVLDESQRSFTWLKSNPRHPEIKNNLWAKIFDVQKNIRKKTAAKSIDELLANPQGTIAATVASKGVNEDIATKWVEQVQELDRILDEEQGGGFDNFYNFYLKNTNIETLRERDEISDEIVNPADTLAVQRLAAMRESGDEDGGEELENLEELDDNPEGAAIIHGKGPNEENPLQKATAAVQDYFRGQPAVKEIKDGKIVYALNEFDLPDTYDYASVFGKAKQILEGEDTLERIKARLMEPSVLRHFPQAKQIYDDLVRYEQPRNGRIDPENNIFLRQFVKVMSLPEVDNKKLTINFDALGTNGERTLVTMRTQSRSGEVQDINQWQFSVRRPTEDRFFKTLGPQSTPGEIFSDTSASNLFWNMDGNLYLNPFFDTAELQKMNERTVLALFGIKCYDAFWENDKSTLMALRVKSMLIHNLRTYKTYLSHRLNTKDPLGTFEKNAAERALDPSMDDVRYLISEYFIDNPIQRFRERRTYSIGDKKTIDTRSLYPALADLSAQNSFYAPYASARSFSDGSGKLKYPYYEASLLTHRVNLLNRVDHISDFDGKNSDDLDALDFVSLNPNESPWLRETVFYRAMFDRDGRRKTVSGEFKDRKTGKPLSNQKVRMELSDLSSFETIQDGTYSITHPKNLNALDKFFFDTITLIRDGYIEIPRAATSSTVMALRLNAYDAFGKGDDFTTQYLPIDVTSVHIFNHPKFRGIMQSYLSAELMKLKWYFDKNPTAVEDDPNNYMAHQLNVFRDILKDGLDQTIIDKVKALPVGDINGQADDIRKIVLTHAQEINLQLRDFFLAQVNNLYDGNNGVNFKNLSGGQRSVLKNILNLYENEASDGMSSEEKKLETKIGEALDESGESSVFQSSVEVANKKMDESAKKILATFVANQFILNVEYHTWFMGDNYLFSNPFKRGNLSTNTGTMGNVSRHTNAILNSPEIKGDTLNSIMTGKKSFKDFRVLNTHVIKEVKTRSRSIESLVADRLAYARQFMGITDDAALQAERIRYERSLGDAPRDGDGKILVDPETGKPYKQGAYYAMKGADGQSKMNLDAYRNLRIIYGNWDWSKDEKEYRRQQAIFRLKMNLYNGTDGDIVDDAGNIVTQRQQDEALAKKPPFSEFNPQKFSYTGPELLTDASGKLMHSPMRTKFDKTSFKPLLPEALLGSGHADEQLMLQMIREDIDYVKMESAAKGVVHDSMVEFYDETGNYKPGANLANHRPEKLLSAYLKWQLGTDGMHKDNTYGSQQRAMFFDVKYLPEIQNSPSELSKIEALETKFLKSVGNIMDYQRAHFMNRFGLKWVEVGSTKQLEIESMDRFAEAINTEAKKNNFPTNMMEYLKYDPSSQTYTFDPSLLFNRKQLIDTIGGLIDKELRRLKTKGTAAIQVSSIGATKNHNFTNPTDEQIKKYGTNGLHYYAYEYDDQGKIKKTSTMGIKITLQGDFKNLLNIEWEGSRVGTLEKLNKLLAHEEKLVNGERVVSESAFRKKFKEQLTFLGYRIPTNNNNFIDHVEIMEFLPESEGNIIIAPPEHTIKSGSDFDVDKMNFIFPSITGNGSLTSKPTRSIEEIYKEINARTTNMVEYKKRQQTLQKDIKNAKRDVRGMLRDRNKLEEVIRQDLMDIDERETTRRYIDMAYASKPFAEIVAAFQTDIDASYPEVAEKLKDLKTYDNALGTDVSENDKKVDRVFLDLQKELAQYKDYHTNEMLDHLKRTMEHPAYLSIMTTPSNTDYLSEQAERIGRLTGRKVTDNLSSTQNTTYSVVNAKHNEYMYFTKDLGLYAIQRRWFSLLNFSRMELNRSWKYGERKQADSSRGFPMHIFTPLADPGKRNDLVNPEVVKVHGTNLDGMMINDVWDQFMSLTIDLPSNTIYTLFGINKLNRKLLQYLIISRYSIPAIMSFINQPILQEVYAKYEEESKNLRWNGQYQLKHAMIEVAKNRGIKGKGFDKVWDKSTKAIYDTYKQIDPDTGEILGVDIYTPNPGVFAHLQLSDDDYFDPEQMDQDIQDTDWKNKEFKERQQKILLYFMAANLEASNFSGMQFTYSDDRNKNTSYYTILENDRKKEQLRGMEDDVFSVPEASMFSKEALMRLEKESIYQPFNYTKFARLFYEKFATRFTNPFVSSGIAALLGETNSFGIDRQLLASRMEGDFVEMIYKNFADVTLDEYDPFTDKITTHQEKFSDYFMKRVFKIDTEGGKKVDTSNFRTYGDKLDKFLQRYPELMDISFVAKLYAEGINAIQRDKHNEKTGSGFDPNEPEKPKKVLHDDYNPMDAFMANVIRFRRSQDNTVAERNRYIKELENLIHFNPGEFRITKKYSDEDVRKIGAFFTELSYLTLYQAGPTNIADNFSDLLPTHLWQGFISRAFANYEKVIVNERRITETTFMRLFSMMYRENNPKVPWKSAWMNYDVRFYGRKDLDQSERNLARNTNGPTKYFLNFRAGKFYDLERFAKRANFSNIPNLTC